MKKIIPILFIISILFIVSSKDEGIIIPNNAIRFRVIANSNTLEDQAEKLVIKNQIEKIVYEKLPFQFILPLHHQVYHLHYHHVLEHHKYSS